VKAGGACLCLAALIAATSTAHGAGVVFSEIMYHPVDGITNVVDGDQYEFLELRNAGPVSVNLLNASFTKGITYTFTNAAVLAPGAHTVVVKNRAAFTNRYASVTNLAPGAYTGSLANNGEQVTLKDALGNTLYSVTYGTDGGWTTWADGKGCSLVLRDPDGNPDDPANWGPSAQFNGTPGATGGVVSADIVINEVLSHTDPPLEDAVELYNTTTSAVDMTGWYLSDDPAVRKKYRITNGVIQAKGFKVFYEYQFNTNALFNTNNIPFEFSSDLGDKAFLTAADANSNLTRVVDIAEFEAAENGVSFGRYPDGAGDWVTLDHPTFGVNNPPSLGAFRAGSGASNAPPKVGPVVISEIMYHPANDNSDYEYIELLNTAATATPLYDPVHPSNTWHLTKAVDYTFPTNVSLPAGGRLLVVGATNIPAFRAAYGLSPAMTVLGPWTGKLDNAGESVRLYKPDPPTPGTNLVPYILVDRVDYGDSPPWPDGPDGNGPSLERVVATNYGNTAANWFTGAVKGSPGTAPAGGFVSAQVDPTWPQPGQSFTVSVFVVSQSVPTQVVCRTVINGVTNLLTMVDNGTKGDRVAGDRIFTITNVAPPSGTWMYYNFQGGVTGAPAFVYPPLDLRSVRAPPVTVDLCGAKPRIIASAGTDWSFYEIMDAVGAGGCFSIHLEAPGEVLLDDVSLTDETGAEYVANGSFGAPLAGPWGLHGNHASSYIETLADEGSNRVLHVVSQGIPAGWDVVSQALSPAIAAGTTATLRFRARRVREPAEQWLWTRIGTPPADPVINEIMYHSIQENDLTGIDPHEYVELFNPGTSSVDLAGWYLDGAGFDFTNGIAIGAGKFLVCCASQQAVRVSYGITNTVGNWLDTRAQLKNGGETVTLYNPWWRPVDTVDYNDKEPWPVAADGYGPSLERILVTGAGSTSANWSASATGTNWITVAWTGQVGVANASFCFFFSNFTGRCWLDSVSVKVSPGGTSNLVSNDEFEQGTNGWSLLGNHSMSRVEPGIGFGGSNGMAIAGTYNRWQVTINGALAIVLAYGDAASNCVASAPIATTQSGTYAVSFRVRREGLCGDIWAVLGNVATNVALGRFGTPGTTNTSASAVLPVGITDVWTDYTTCPLGTANVVRARTDTPAAVSNTMARYRVVTSNAYQFTDAAYASVAMRDDGVAPDLIATDGVYAAYIPGVSTNRAIVRYHVLVTATNGTISRRPHADDPSTDYGYWVETGSVQSNLPNWYLFVDGSPVMYPISARVCAVAPNGQVFSDAIVRHRGNPMSGYEDRTGIALRVNRGNPLDTWFAKNQGGINFRHRGNGHSHTLYRRVINEYVGYELQRTMGLATPRIRHSCLWINGAPTITLELEDPEDAFLSGNDVPSSDYLTQIGYGGVQYIGGDRALDNFWTVYSALNNVTGPQKQSVFRTHLAYEEFQQSLALLAVTANADEHFDWNMFQHRSATDFRWRQYPWDVDMSFDYDIGTTNQHPYYSTPLHPGLYEGTSGNGFLATSRLYYPESGTDSEYTLPYRYRQQRSVWRMCHTLFTTNYLYPILDTMQTNLVPVYQQVGSSKTPLTNEVQKVKDFIAVRRNFLLNQSWSDKRADVWGEVYNPTNVVITELMISPPVKGQEYIELRNLGT
jgi:hypothetical protein